MSRKPVFIIEVTGAAGCGKSMFVRMLADKFAGKVVHIASDMYYKDIILVFGKKMKNI